MYFVWPNIYNTEVIQFEIQLVEIFIIGYCIILKLVKISFLYIAKVSVYCSTQCSKMKVEDILYLTIIFSPGITIHLYILLIQNFILAFTF